MKIQWGEIAEFTKTGVVYSDTAQDADIVVFATGFVNIHESVRRICGDVVMERIPPIWGLDEETTQGESSGKPSISPLVLGRIVHQRADIVQAAHSGDHRH